AGATPPRPGLGPPGGVGGGRGTGGSRDAGGLRGTGGGRGALAYQPPGEQVGHHRATPPPSGRCWGFTVQLYSLLSCQSWGHGDLGDLADLAAWSARDLGASFVLINPLHAAEPVPPVSASPYLPMSRRFISPLYLRVEDIGEYALLSGAQRRRIEELAAPLRAANIRGGLIDPAAVWRAQCAALVLISSRS